MKEVALRIAAIARRQRARNRLRERRCMRDLAASAAETRRAEFARRQLELFT